MSYGYAPQDPQDVAGTVDDALDHHRIRRDLAGRVRRILTALETAQDIERLQGPPGWRIHQLTGDPCRDVEHLRLGQLVGDLRSRARRDPQPGSGG